MQEFVEFAVYLLYTWNYSGKKRVWNKDIFLGGRKKGHLPYQLRTYRMLDAAMGRLKTLKNICAKENICTKEYICTSDGKRLEEQFFDEVENLTFEMINSFERSLHMFFAETEDICELAQDQRLQELYEMTIKEQKEDIPEISPQNIPWLLGYELEGQAELKRVNDLWKDVSKHLADNGTYCRLREFAEWVPLERTLGADHVRAI